MTDRHEPDALAPTPEVRRSRWSVSLIWLVPIVAALIGLSMVIHSWASRGPTTTRRASGSSRTTNRGSPTATFRPRRWPMV